MYRALYPFEDSTPNVLPCKAGDRFTVLESKDEHWWLVQNGTGRLGYIPASYLVVDEAGHQDVLRSIDHAIESVKQKIINCKDKSALKDLNANLKKLQKHQSNVVAEHQKLVSSSSTKRRAPVVAVLDKNAAHQDSVQAKGTSTTCVTKQEPSSVCVSPIAESVLHTKPVPEVDKRTACDSGFGSSTSSTDMAGGGVNAQQVPAGLGAEMVERVRLNTGLSFAKSIVAVASSMTLLRERVPGVQSIVNSILEDLQSIDSEDSGENESSDAVQLREIFNQLESVKDDSQQRSWILHEDEATICRNLDDLISILSGAKPTTCRRVLASDSYSACHNLALYYQMETRLSIRLLLLQVFCAMCSLDQKVVSELLSSVLPLELARDIQTDLSDIQKVEYSVLVLAMLFCTGEAIPLQCYEHLNTKFVDFLLDNVENPPSNDEADELPDMLVKLILAYNLHFELPDENLVMKTLVERGTAKTFTEKLLLLFNREDDPTHMFDYQSKSTNSVLKFLSDLFSCRQTANLLYTNDAKVLIDIIVRQLSDLSPGERIRTDYLSLIHLLLTNSDYEDHRHRQSELSACFVRIAREDVDMDRDIVRMIWTQFAGTFNDAG